MASLTFADLSAEVYDQAGLDSTDTGNQTRVARWINFTQQNLCSRYPWSFMLGHEAIVTIPDYTTGTVSVSNGGTTVTGAGTTFTAAMAVGAQYYIQFSTQIDWYPISAFSSATSITIANPYQQPNGAGLKFIIRKRWYSLSAAADRILDIVNWDTPVKLVELDPRSIDDFYPDTQSTNSSYGYFPYGYDISGNLQISPYPFPSDARLLEIKTRTRPVDMSGTALPSIPNKYALVIAWGATSLAFAYLRKMDIAEAWNQKYLKEIESMKVMSRTTTDYQPLLRSIDSGQVAKGIQFPSQWPSVRV